MPDKQQFTRIQGLAQSYTGLPVLGRINLGEAPSSDRNHPTAKPHFVFSEQVIANFPEILDAYVDKNGVFEPKMLDVILPSEDLGMVLPHFYALFGGNNRLKCQGDGVNAVQHVCQKCQRIRCAHHKEPRILQPIKCRDQRKCPEAESGACLPRCGVRFILWRVTWCGVFEVWTKSWNSLRGLRDGLAGIRNQCGRISYIPLRLRLVLTQIKHGGKPTKKHLLRIGIHPDIGLVKKYLARNPPILSLELPPLQHDESIPASGAAAGTMVDEGSATPPQAPTPAAASASIDDPESPTGGKTAAAAPAVGPQCPPDAAAVPAEPIELITEARCKALMALAKQVGWKGGEWNQAMARCGIEGVANLTELMESDGERLEEDLLKVIEFARNLLIEDIRELQQQVGLGHFQQIIKKLGITKTWTAIAIGGLRELKDELKAVLDSK